MKLRSSADLQHAYNDMVVIGNKTSDEKTINGFIRALWNENEFEIMRYPPHYLLKIISRYYESQILYQIGYRKSLHCINMNDIQRQL